MTLGLYSLFHVDVKRVPIKIVSLRLTNPLFLIVISVIRFLLMSKVDAETTAVKRSGIRNLLKVKGLELSLGRIKISICKNFHRRVGWDFFR